MDNIGTVPDPCGKPHNGQYARQTYLKYQHLVDELRRRRRLLGLSQEDVGAAAGLTEGHINKLESHARTAQLPTLQIWAETLGVEITISPAALPAATIRAIEHRSTKPYEEGKAHFTHATGAPNAIEHDE